MAKATAILSQSPIKPNGPPIYDGRVFIVHAVAMFAARGFVKQRLKQEGHIVSHYKASELSQLANAYLEANRPRLDRGSPPADSRVGDVARDVGEGRPQVRAGTRGAEQAAGEGSESA